MLIGHDNVRVLRVGGLFCGIGAGLKGFKDARPRIAHVQARWEIAGGVDVDAGAIRNFDRITGARGTVMDLFDREQYIAFHGCEPPKDWQEAQPSDIRAAHGDRPLDAMFITAPCKGLSGLLSNSISLTDKYQALNRLTLRGIMLTLEAYKDDPVPIILFENVPRILTRGRHFLDQIEAVLRADGYAVAETKHDCGEIGNLAQSRNRFLMVARHMAKVPPFLYQPVKYPLRGVGEVIGQLPLPGDPRAGVMHRVPSLQWKTWVRLAFVPAGKDWRALNDLSVENGILRDYGISPDLQLRDNALGVLGWGDTAPTLTSQRSPGQGRFSVADPRIEGAHNEALGIRPWDAPARVVAGSSRSMNGAHNVADPRPQQTNQSFGQYGVRDWEETVGTVTGQAAPGGGPNSVADPRLGRTAYCNIYRVVAFADPAGSITSSRDVAVADPRAMTAFAGAGKYRVTAYDEPAGTVIAGSTTGQGAFCIADPRPTHGPNAHHNKMKVVDAADPAPTVTGSDRVGSGALSVADPRPVCLNAEGREGYATQGHYGVNAWDEPALAIPGYAKHDRGKWSIADPRHMIPEPLPALPSPTDRMVARIIALDGTWHRPFTTLELAALQSLFDPGEIFDLEGGSDQLKREWIGNAVPSAAARGMAETIGETLLLADMGETFTLSSREIWVKPLALALAVDPTQPFIEALDREGKV
jgi:site-specific DNA-cytosine methylase